MLEWLTLRKVQSRQEELKMSEVKDVLKQCVLCKNLSDADLNHVEAVCEQQMVLPGDPVAKKGHAADRFYVLAAGALLLEMADGRSAVLVSPGDFAGFGMLASHDRYTATLTALEKGRVLAVNREGLTALIRGNESMESDIAREWAAYLSETVPFLEPEDLLIPDH